MPATTIRSQHPAAARQSAGILLGTVEMVLHDLEHGHPVSISSRELLHGALVLIMQLDLLAATAGDVTR